MTFVLYTKLPGDIRRRGRRSSRTLRAAMRRACTTKRGGIQARVVDSAGREYEPSCSTRRRR